MAQIVKWNDITFSLGGSSILGIEGIGITGSCETEDSTVDGEKFVKRKNGKPYEIEMTALLDARLGIDVQSMATKMTEAARCSASGYFYTGSAKLFPCSFMMISAAIGEIILNPNGKWIGCKVKLKLKQSTKFDGNTSSAAAPSSGGGGSSGSSSSSSKKTSTKTTSTTTSHLPMTGVSSKSIAAVQAAHKAGTTSTSKTASSVSSAIKQAAAATSAAKAASKTVTKPASNVSNKVKAMLK